MVIQASSVSNGDDKVLRASAECICNSTDLATRKMKVKKKKKKKKMKELEVDAPGSHSHSHSNNRTEPRETE